MNKASDGSFSMTDRLIMISNICDMVLSLTELTQFREQLRPEFRGFDRETQQWIVDKFDSTTWRLENPGVSDEELTMQIKGSGKNGKGKRKSFKGKREHGVVRTRQKTAKDRGTDSLALWKEAFRGSE